MTETASTTILPYTIGMVSDVGQQRSHNEDTALVFDLPGADASFLLCDGMGGLRAGDVASREAVREIATTLQARFAHGVPADPLAELGAAFGRANDAVNGLHRGFDSDEDADDAPTERPANRAPANALMGTTCVAGIVVGATLYLAHAGDSRAYLLRGGALTRLTEDHSYVAERVRAGDITEAEAKVSRFRNMITRAIGIEPTATPELREVPLQTGDSVLVCSDGLTNEIDDARIADILRINVPERVSPEKAAQQLVDAANRAGGSDNVTAVLLRAGAGVGDSPVKVAATQKIPAAPSVVAPAPPVSAPKISTVTKSTDSAPPVASAKSPAKPPVASKVGGTATAANLNGGGIVDIDAPPSTWRPRRRGMLSFGSVLLGIALAIGAAIAVFALSPDARRETVRVLRGQTPPEAEKERQNDARQTLDFTKLAYAAPTRFSDIQARGDFLSYSRGLGLVCAGVDLGAVQALSPTTGRPARTGLATLPPVPPGKPGAGDPAASHLYVATDPSGDLYFSSPKAGTIEKRGPDGKSLLTLKGFTRPEALALDDDGNLYVVDANLIKVIRAHPASAAPAGAASASPAVAKATSPATAPSAVSDATSGG